MWRTRFFVGVGLAVLVLLASLVTGKDQEAPTMAVNVPGFSIDPTKAVPRVPGAPPTGGIFGGIKQQAPAEDPYAGDPYAGATAYAEPAPAPSRLLAESPEWLAYLNALGLEEQAARADMDKQRALYQSDATRQLQDLPIGYQQQRRGVAGSLESRGMARSGELLRRMAENRAAQGRAEAGVNSQLAFQIGSLESSLAQKLMQLNTQRAQQEMALRSQGYV